MAKVLKLMFCTQVSVIRAFEPQLFFVDYRFFLFFIYVRDLRGAPSIDPRFKWFHAGIYISWRPCKMFKVLANLSETKAIKRLKRKRPSVLDLDLFLEDNSHLLIR